MNKDVSGFFLKYGLPVTVNIAVTALVYSWVSEENKQKVLLGGVGGLLGLLSSIYSHDSTSTRNKIQVEQPGPRGFVLIDDKNPYAPGFTL